MFRIRIQHFRLNTDPEPDPIRIQGFDEQKLGNIFCWNKKFDIFLSKIAIYLSLGLHKGRPSYKTSLQPSKENIHHFKSWNFFTFFYFYGSFLPSWIRMRYTRDGTERGGGGGSQQVRDDKVLINTEYQSVCPLVGIGTPPTPLLQATVPPLNQRVGGRTRLRVRVWGVPIPTTGEKA